MNQLLLLPLGLVVFISGCTVPGTDIDLLGIFGPPVISLEDDVIILRSLEAIPSTITYPQQVRVLALVENKGTEKYPIPGIDDTTKIEVNLFDFCDGLFEQPEIDNCGIEGDNDEGNTCFIGSLLPGEVRQVSWTLKPREQNLITTCDFKVAITYPYQTSGLTSIHLINPDEYDRQLTQGTYQQQQSTISQGDGPVKAHFEVKDVQPIPLHDDGDAETTITLVIENEGNGFIKGTDRSEVTLLDANILGGSGIFQATDDCHFKVGDKIELIQNTRELPCNIGLPDKAEVPRETSGQLTVDIAYTYEFTREVRVTVEPQ